MDKMDITLSKTHFLGIINILLNTSTRRIILQIHLINRSCFKQESASLKLNNSIIILIIK